MPINEDSIREKKEATVRSIVEATGLLLKEKDNRCEKVILMNSNFWADSEQKKKDRSLAAPSGNSWGVYL